MWSGQEEIFILDYEEDIQDSLHGTRGSRRGNVFQHHRVVPFVVALWTGWDAMCCWSTCLVPQQFACWSCGTWLFSYSLIVNILTNLDAIPIPLMVTWTIWLILWTVPFNFFLPNLTALLPYLVDIIDNSSMLPQSSSPLKPIDLLLINKYCQVRKIAADIIKCNSTTCAAVLLHWMVLLVLPQQLTPQYLFAVRNFSPTSFTLTAIDSHLHLDQIRK